MRRLRGVIFDLDGVLVSTDMHHYRAWKRLADELGMSFSEEQNHLLRGVSRDESLRIIYRLNNRPLPPVAEFNSQTSRKNTYYVELLSGMSAADILPGAREVLAGLRTAGILVAVASSSKNTPLVLNRTGLASLIDAVADGNDITRSKPDPEVFLVAARRLGVSPADCIGVEDAAAGVEAIRAAGMLAVGIGEAAGGAVLTVPSVKHLSTNLLIQLVK